MNRLQRWLRHLPPWALPVSLTGMALLAAACAALWLTPQWERQATAQQAEAARAQQSNALARRRQAAAATAWRDSLSAPAQLDARLAALLGAALRSDVSLLSAEQAPAEPAADGVSRLRLNLSLRGSYAALRRFVQAVLRADPGLAVERISFSRSRVEDSLLDARVQLSLMQRQDAEPVR